MGYGGWIKDKQSGAAIPRATAESWYNDKLIHRTIATDAGYFTISSFIPATIIKVSSVGYKTAIFPADPTKMLYELEKDVKDLPGVTLPPGGQGGGNKTGLLIFAILAAIIISQNKK